MEEEKAREDKAAFLRFSSISAWNNELRLISPAKKENISLMLAPRTCGLEHTRSGTKTTAFDAVMLQWQVSGLTSFLNCNNLFLVF